MAKALQTETDADSGFLRYTILGVDGKPTSFAVEVSVPNEVEPGFWSLSEIGKKALIEGIDRRMQSARQSARGEEAWHKLQNAKSALCSGQWSLRGSGSKTVRQKRPTIFVEALMRRLDKSQDAVEAALQAYTDEQLEELKRKPSVRAEMERIRAERLEAKSSEDDEGLLSELAEASEDQVETEPEAAA